MSELDRLAAEAEGKEYDNGLSSPSPIDRLAAEAKALDKVPAQSDGEFVKGLKAGVKQIEGMGYGLTAMAGKAVGAKGVEDWGVKNYQQNQKGAPTAKVGSYKDIHDLGSFADYITYGIASNLPNMLVSMASGGLGYFAGRKLAQGAITSALDSAVAKGMERKVAEKLLDDSFKSAAKKYIEIGSGAGAALSSVGMEAGSITGNQIEAGEPINPGRAALAAIPAGLLDVVPEWYLVKRLGLFGDATKFAGKGLKDRAINAAKGFGQQFAMEAPTEAAQSVIERAGTSDKTSLNDRKAWDEYIDSFLLGGLTGGVMGGAGGFIEKSTPKTVKEKVGSDPTGQSINKQMDSMTDEIGVLSSGIEDFVGQEKAIASEPLPPDVTSGEPPQNETTLVSSDQKEGPSGANMEVASEGPAIAESPEVAAKNIDLQGQGPSLEGNNVVNQDGNVVNREHGAVNDVFGQEPPGNIVTSDPTSVDDLGVAPDRVVKINKDDVFDNTEGTKLVTRPGERAVQKAVEEQRSQDIMKTKTAPDLYQRLDALDSERSSLAADRASSRPEDGNVNVPSRLERAMTAATTPQFNVSRAQIGVVNAMKEGREDVAALIVERAASIARSSKDPKALAQAEKLRATLSTQKEVIANVTGAIQQKQQDKIKGQLEGKWGKVQGEMDGIGAQMEELATKDPAFKETPLYNLANAKEPDWKGAMETAVANGQHKLAKRIIKSLRNASQVMRSHLDNNLHESIGVAPDDVPEAEAWANLAQKSYDEAVVAQRTERKRQASEAAAMKKYEKLRNAGKMKEGQAPPDIKTRIRQLGGIALGRDYNRKEAGQDLERGLLNGKRGMSLDDLAGTLADEGYKGFTNGDELYEHLKSGGENSVVAVGQEDETLTEYMEGELNDWIESRAADEGIDLAAEIEENEGDIRDGLSEVAEEEGATQEDVDEFFDSLIEQIDRKKGGNTDGKSQETETLLGGEKKNGNVEKALKDQEKLEKATVNAESHDIAAIDDASTGSDLERQKQDAEDARTAQIKVGSRVRIGENIFGVVVGLSGGRAQVRPENAKSPKAYRNVSLANVVKVDGVDIAYSRLGSPEGEALGKKLGEESGKLGADMDRLIQLLGAQMYKANIADVCVKELLQNSFDAVKAFRAKTNAKRGFGNINIDLDQGDRTISLSDDGVGMNIDIVKKAFFTIAGTYKEDLPTELRSGGLGMAKMAFMFGSQRISVDTVRDGVRIKVTATPAQIANGDFRYEMFKAKKSDHGTTVTVEIPRDRTDPMTGETSSISFPSYVQYMAPIGKPLIGDVQVTYTEGKNDIDPKVLPLGVNFDTSKRPLLTKAHFAWGDADIYVGIDMETYPSHQILSSGVFQFQHRFSRSRTETIPYSIVVNIKPKVSAEHPDYPFTNNREGFKDRIAKDIVALTGYLTKIASGREMDGLQQNFKNIKELPRVDAGGAVREANEQADLENAQKARAAFGASFEDKIKPPDEGPGEIQVDETGVRDMADNWLSQIRDQQQEGENQADDTFQADHDAPTRDQFLENPDHDPKNPLFHNNTNVDYAKIGEAAGGNPQLFFAEIGSLFTEMKELLANSGLYGYDVYKDLFFSGISIDKGYAGVQIRVPYKATYINPFGSTYQPKTIFSVAHFFMTTMIHELAHANMIATADHGPFHDQQMESVQGYIVDEGMYDYFLDSILSTLLKHEAAYTAMRREFGKSSTKNVSKSLGETRSAIVQSAAKEGSDGSLGTDKSGVVQGREGQGGSQALPRSVGPDTKDVSYSASADKGVMGMGVKRVQKVVDLAKSFLKNPPKINVLPDTQAAPKEVLADMAENKMLDPSGDSNAQGFAWNGEVYIIANNCESDTDALKVLLHELTHNGLRTFFANLKNKTTRLKSIQMKHSLLMDAIYREKTPEVQAIVINSQKQINLRTAEGRRAAAEEWLCNQTYANQPKWYDRYVALAQDVLRALGFKAKLSDSEVRVALQNAFTSFGDKGGGVQYMVTAFRGGNPPAARGGQLGHGVSFTSLEDIAKGYAEAHAQEQGSSVRDIYKTNLHEENDPHKWTWLDLNKPLSDKVYGKVTSFIKDNYADNYALQELTNTMETFRGGFSGSHLYQQLSWVIGSDEETSQFLLEAGIDGNRYPAGMLTGLESEVVEKTGKTGTDYVVFNEAAVPAIEHVQYSLKSVLGDNAAKAIKNAKEQIMRKDPDIPKEVLDNFRKVVADQHDLPWIHRALNLPFRMAQKFPEWKKAWEIHGITRPEERQRITHEIVNVMKPFLNMDKEWRADGISKEQIAASKEKIEKVLIAGDVLLIEKARDLKSQIAAAGDGADKGSMQKELDQLLATKRYSAAELKAGITDENGQEIAPMDDREILAYNSVRDGLDTLYENYIDHLSEMTFRQYQDKKWYALLMQASGTNLDKTETLKLLKSHGLDAAALLRARRIAPDMKKLWDRLDKESDKLFDSMPDKKEMDAAGALYKKLATDLQAELKKFRGYVSYISGVTDAQELDKMTKEIVAAYSLTRPQAKKVKALRNNPQNWIGYFPRIREKGKFKIRLVEPIFDVASGIQVGERTKHMVMVDNERDFANAYNEMMAKYGKDGKLPEGQRIKPPEPAVVTPEAAFVGVSDVNLQKVFDDAMQNLATRGKLGNLALDEILDSGHEVLANQLASRGSGARGIHRSLNNIKGYKEKGLQEVLSQYISGMAGLMTKQIAAADSMALMKTIKEPTMFSAIRKYTSEQLRNETMADRVSGKLRSMAFYYYMGVMVKSAVVNVTQNPIMGFAWLGKYMRENKVGGAGKSDVVYMKAMHDVALGHLDTLDQRIIKDLVESGIAEDKLIKSIFANVKGYGAAWKVGETLSGLFSHAEIYNRKSAGVAMFRTAYPLELQRALGKGMTQAQAEGVAYKAAFAACRQFIDDVHFAYGKANRPLVMQSGDFTGTALATAYTFRAYNHNFLANMVTVLGEGDFKTFAHSMAYIALLGGLAAVPFFKDLDEWVEKGFGYSPFSVARKALHGLGGETLEKIGIHGLPAMMGANISGSLATGLPWPIGSDDPVESIGGVYFGLAQKATKALGWVGKGEMGRAIEEASPEAFRSAMAAARESEFGGKYLGTPGYASNQRGRPILNEKGEKISLSNWEASLKALGFNPAEYSSQKEKVAALTRLEKWVADRKNGIAENYRIKAKINNEPGALKEMTTQVHEFNQLLKDRGLSKLVPLMRVSNVIKASRTKKGKKFYRESAYQQAEM